MKELSYALKKTLTGSVQRNSAEALLFSGGLDTSILAALNPRMRMITVSLKSYGEDIRYANLISRELKLAHFHRAVEAEEALDSIPEVIKILKTFDPALPNDLVVYFGLKYAQQLGVKKVMTGDGADELFAGYEFMQHLRNLDAYLERMNKSMRFSSNVLGRACNIKIRQPYLDKEMKALSLKIPSIFKIKKEKGKIWGKWILRKTFEDLLSKEIIWQSKRPLEYGSGMTRLRKIISDHISDGEFKKAKKNDRVKFMNKEHFYYYKVYKEVVGAIPGPKKNEKGCPGCGAGMKVKSLHCRICGWAGPINE